ncbi:DUF3696 domain-containing protein [uncultured Sphingomonas sp.]|uniref:DUF3696 domain-containing protein n=1 Tax=uncultured Sphingomonas sp. TaxID=158754 RepID=UPI0025D90417|nr:DUF3696 domain-containing protein [uncultured Sphingomonas sp.]
MLDSLHISNFKTWRSALLDFGLLTGLFGTNSSGKSSLIQFMLMLKQTKEATDRGISLDLNGRLAKLGSFEDVVHNHNTEDLLSWQIGFEVDHPLTLQDPSTKRSEYLVRSNEFSVGAEVGGTALGPLARVLRYQVDDQVFTLSRKKSDANAFDLRASGSAFKFVRTPGRAWQLPGPIKSYAFPDQARTYFQNASLLADLESAYEREVDRIFYLGPLREYPKREYVWGRSRPVDVGVRGELVVDAILAATLDGAKYNLFKKGRLQTFQEIVAYWLKAMGLISNFEIRELAPGSSYYQAVVKVRDDSPPALLTDVGFGVSQVLPIIVLLYYVPAGSTVILEQPEIHLHPLAQSALADLLINVATYRGVQILFESHSEHLLLRMQRRIAEEEVDAEDIKLYFTDYDEGSSHLHELEIDEYGQILNWPENFMGDAFGETLAAEKARLKRMAKK